MGVARAAITSQCDRVVSPCGIGVWRMGWAYSPQSRISSASAMASGARNPRCADRNPPRFDAPDSAHYAYRRTLTCGPRGCGPASHHTIGSTFHLSPRSCLCREGRRIALQSDERFRCARRARLPEELEEQLPPRARESRVPGPVAPHSEVHGVFGDGRLIDEFRRRPSPDCSCFRPTTPSSAATASGPPATPNASASSSSGTRVRGARDCITRSGRLRSRRRCLRRLPIL